MKKTGWILAAALVLLVGWAAYPAAQQAMGGQPGMQGMPGMMMGGQPGQTAQMEAMMKAHGLTAEQAKALGRQCTQVIAQAAPAAPETK